MPRGSKPGACELFAKIESGTHVASFPSGNSRAAALRRLRKDRPDLQDWRGSERRQLQPVSGRTLLIQPAHTGRTEKPRHAGKQG